MHSWARAWCWWWVWVGVGAGAIAAVESALSRSESPGVRRRKGLHVGWGECVSQSGVSWAGYDGCVVWWQQRARGKAQRL